MTRLKWAYRGMCVYAAFNMFFMIGYYHVTGKDNMYPFFTWHIFRPEPYKYVSETQLVIHQYDSVVLDQPKAIQELAKEFPNIKPYRFAGKYHELAVLLYYSNSPLTPEDEERVRVMREDIETELLKNHKTVKYELLYLRVEPIEYFLNKKYETRKVVLSGDLIREGREQL